jgi:hypothetical protein
MTKDKSLYNYYGSWAISPLLYGGRAIKSVSLMRGFDMQKKRQCSSGRGRVQRAIERVVHPVADAK